MIFWMLMLFFSGYMAAVHIKAMEAGMSAPSMSSLIIFAVIATFSGVACYRSSRNDVKDENWSKIVDQFVKSWDRVSYKLSSGRWVLTIVSALAFGMFCYAICKILVVAASKLPDTTVVALFMFVANIVQNVFKDYFNMDRDDANGGSNGISNGSGGSGASNGSGIDVAINSVKK